VKKKLMAIAVGLLVSAGMVTISPTAAQAAGRDGVCNDGEFCLYFNSDNEGSVSDFTTSIPDYGFDQPTCYEFKGDGNGKGKCVKNDAASFWNRTDNPVTVCYKHDYAGSSQVIGAGSKGNFNSVMKNENASHKLNTNDPTNENLTHGLYDANGGTITCAFDGYVRTDGRHEGIDMAKGIGSPVYALVPGTVINVVQGSNGSGGLSTIAVYNSDLNKTVIYLHSDPLNSLHEGDTVRRETRIATEAWHGVSSSSAAHTHVEMRPGRHELAAKSVGDDNLENPNPTSFWNDRGYNVR
jgi:murein DD-endopeptidase MepM/ murein hydrolase activator NlpD